MPPVFVLVICLSGQLWPEDSCDDSPDQSQRPLECRVQEPFWQWASLRGLPRQRDWTGVMIAIRQLYEYLWLTSALENRVRMLYGSVVELPLIPTGCGAMSQPNRSCTADVWQASGGVKGCRWRGVRHQQVNQAFGVKLITWWLQGPLGRNHALKLNLNRCFSAADAHIAHDYKWNLLIGFSEGKYVQTAMQWNSIGNQCIVLWTWKMLEVIVVRVLGS